VTHRLFIPEPLAAADSLALPPHAVRHVQALRLQPGDTVALFDDSDDAERPATIVEIGRNRVLVRLDAPVAVQRELAWRVTLAVGVPANDRMDALVEKAGELGAAAIQPLVCARSVVRLAGERAEARQRHWQAVASSASEQCGRARVSAVLPIASFADWLAASGGAATDASGGKDPAVRIVLSLADAAIDPERALADPLGTTGASTPAVVVLSGPEGGLAPAEEDAAVARGFVRVGLGPRVLRADTAPLALLAWLALRAPRAAKEDRR
jgi:16S rRNA (uracil1498-N3)-methyltransferase